MKQKLEKLFKELEEVAYNTEYHYYFYKEANQVIRKHFEALILPDVINWVAVKDEVPPERIPIIIWGKGTVYEESVYTKKHGFAGRFDYDVTHWTPMPKPPCL